VLAPGAGSPALGDSDKTRTARPRLGRAGRSWQQAQFRPADAQYAARGRRPAAVHTGRRAAARRTAGRRHRVTVRRSASHPIALAAGGPASGGYPGRAARLAWRQFFFFLGRGGAGSAGRKRTMSCGPWPAGTVVAAAGGLTCPCVDLHN
jgi:hypothetical protein